MKNYMTLLLAAAFAVGSTFSSQAGSSFKKDVHSTGHCSSIFKIVVMTHWLSFVLKGAPVGALTSLVFGY